MFIRLCLYVYISIIEYGSEPSLSALIRVSSVAFLLACSMTFSSASASRARARNYIYIQSVLSLSFAQKFSHLGALAWGLLAWIVPRLESL